jgi:hypothetical protein
MLSAAKHLVRHADTCRGAGGVAEHEMSRLHAGLLASSNCSPPRTRCFAVLSMTECCGRLRSGATQPVEPFSLSWMLVGQATATPYLPDSPLTLCCQRFHFSQHAIEDIERLMDG